MALLFKDSVARPLHPTDAAPNPAMLPLDLAGLGRGLASAPSREVPIPCQRKDLHHASLYGCWWDHIVISFPSWNLISGVLSRLWLSARFLDSSRGSCHWF